jgi:hypothetical protein
MGAILTAFVSLLTGAGFGGILGAYFQALFQQRSKVGEHEHELKQKRYMCILILMLTKLNPQTGLSKVNKIRSDLRTLNDIEDELRTELLNAVVFASQPVLNSLAELLHHPTKNSFVSAASEMRKDLWGKTASLSAEFVELLPTSMSSSEKSEG